MDHDTRVREEFARQADSLQAAQMFTDRDVLGRIRNAAQPAAGLRLLDVGCGPGIVAAALAPTAREVVALDLTPEMIDKARQRCAAAGLDNVRFELGSAEALPFEDATFDTVVTRLTIHHFADPSRPMAEMARVARPGGRVVVADIVGSDDPEQAALHNAIEILRDPSHVRVLTASGLVGLAQQAGLEVVATETWEMRREGEEWLRIANAPERTGPLATVMRALAAAGVHGGMGLRLENGEVVFTHRWVLVTAEKR